MIGFWQSQPGTLHISIKNLPISLSNFTIVLNKNLISLWENSEMRKKIIMGGHCNSDKFFLKIINFQIFHSIQENFVQILLLPYKNSGDDYKKI